MEKSQEIKELTLALAKFHSTVGKIKKDAKNPFFKSSYASLSHILEEISESLEIAGLVISQFPDGDSLTTMLIHAQTGQYISASFTMPVSKQNDPQALGSSISYARRYAVSSILSLNVSDDDAESAMDRSKKPTATSQEDDKPWLNKSDFDKASEYLRGGGDIEVIKKKYKISKEMMSNLLTVKSNL
jgi:hypothetical protein